MNKIKLSQHPVTLDVADIVTALVGLSAEERVDVLERACAELGTEWLWDGIKLWTAKNPIRLPDFTKAHPEIALLNTGEAE